MASNPTPGACMKCGTALVPGAGFCGTCGTPAGSAGLPPMPPPMPPRPLSHGARQIVLPMDQASAMHAAMNMLPGLKGEITNQGPSQIAYRIGSFLSGRHTGTIDAFQDGPGRTAMNVTMRADYGSLVPGMIIFLAVSMISWILLAKSSVDNMYNPMNPYVMQGPGIGAYIQWWMVLLFVALVGALCAWILSGPMLDKRKQTLTNALQSLGGPQSAGLPGAAPQPGMPMPGAPPQVSPIDQLKRLAELRDSGAISPVDFEQAKANILGKMS